MSSAVRPIRYDMTVWLAGAGYGERVDFSDVPDRYRPAMVDYVLKGIVPPPALLAVLEGRLEAVELFARDLAGLLALVTWMRTNLHAACWGSHNQVQLWVAFARRRACGTALRELGH